MLSQNQSGSSGLTPDTSCSNNSEVSLMKKAKASAAAPNHKENFMAPDENAAGLCCIPHSTLHLRACRNTGGNEFFNSSSA